MKKQDVYKDIRKRILNHDLEPGQWLVERDLSEEYGISRTPVREILFRLLADGLLHREPSRGFMVRALNVEQVVEVFQAREAVEGMAARLACERMGAREHEKLKDLQKRIEAADIDHEPFVGIQLGRELHRIIQESAGNRLLEEFAHKLNSLAILTGNLTSRVPQLERRSRDSHLQIIEALLAKDASGVERLMARHLRETLKGLIREYFGGTVMEPAEELPNEKE